MNQLGGIQQVMGSNGATFKNAYVSYSLCCPSRATILRRPYPHNHDIRLQRSSARWRGEVQKFGSRQVHSSNLAQRRWLPDQVHRQVHEWLHRPLQSLLVGTSGPSCKADPRNNQVNDDGRSITLRVTPLTCLQTKPPTSSGGAQANAAPFFVIIGTKAPHTPPEVVDRHLDRFAKTSLPQPLNFNEGDVSDKPAWVQKYTPMRTDSK